MAAAGDELAKHKLRDEYIIHYKKEYDYYVEYYKAELQKIAPGETIDLQPYHYVTPPAPVVTEAPKSDEETAPPSEEPPADEPPAEDAAPSEQTPEADGEAPSQPEAE